MVPALPHADGRARCRSSLGAGPARRRRDDLQPPHRPRPRAAAELPDPGQHQGRRRAGALSVPVERADSGQDPMAGLCRQRQRHPRPRPQSRRGVSACSACSRPRRNCSTINFLNNNSANFDGLGKLEDLIKQLGPPKWPWLVDTSLAAQGKTIFDRPTAQGGCNDCHGISTGDFRVPAAQPGRRRSRTSGPTPASTISWPGRPRPASCRARPSRASSRR